MARGLKLGDRVKVKKELRFEENSPAAQNGLERIGTRQIGVIVEAAPEGQRAFIVDFKGKRATIKTQQLIIAGKRDESAEPSVEEPNKIVNESAEFRHSSTNVHNSSANYGDQLVNLMANKLLLNGGIRPENEPVVEIRLAELPPDVEQQLRALVEAKLSLGVQNLSGTQATAVPPKPRRGRRPGKRKLP